MSFKCSRYVKVVMRRVPFIIRLKVVISKQNGQELKIHLVSVSYHRKTRTEEKGLYGKTLSRYNNVHRYQKITTRHKVIYLFGIKQIHKQMSFCKLNKGQTPMILIVPIILIGINIFTIKHIH